MGLIKQGAPRSPHALVRYMHIGESEINLINLNFKGITQQCRF